MELQKADIKTASDRLLDLAEESVSDSPVWGTFVSVTAFLGTFALLGTAALDGLSFSRGLFVVGGSAFAALFISRWVQVRWARYVRIPQREIARLEAENADLRHRLDTTWLDRFRPHWRKAVTPFWEAIKQQYSKSNEQTLGAFIEDAAWPFDEETGESSPESYSSALMRFCKDMLTTSVLELSGPQQHEVVWFDSLVGPVKDLLLDTARYLDASDALNDEIVSELAHAHTRTLKVVLYFQLELARQNETYPPGPKYEDLIHLAGHLMGRCYRTQR